MHDIKALEKQWAQYKKNKRKPYYIFILLCILVIGITLYIFSLDKKIFTNNAKMISIKKVESVKNMPTVTFEKPLINGSITILEVEKNIIENRNEMIPTLAVVDHIPVIETVKTDSKDKMIEKQSTGTSKVKRNISIPKPHKKMYLNIIKSSTQSAYTEVEKRFNQFQDPDDSLFLAKSYYAKKEYKKSEYWALRTNKIDKNIEESWIIFVKSKIKLGQKREAIHILSNYVNQSDSKEAKFLLLKLKR